MLYLPGDKPPFLFFPGGHCSAAVDCGWSLYTSLGHGIVSFSRPGYGRTDVGLLTAAEFTSAVTECCEALAISQTAGAVGVSFGGMQAVQVAVASAVRVPRLILHSCAPSTLPFPDTRHEALAGPVVFGPALQGGVWAMLEKLVSSDTGLQKMVGTLSNRPVVDWWDTWSKQDQLRARELFSTMRSGAGFANDLKQARPDRGRYRRHCQTEVRCPTLVTASRADGSVCFAHAQDFAHTIPAATLVELDSPSHLFWIGPERDHVRETVSAFITASG